MNGSASSTLDPTQEQLHGAVHMQSAPTSLRTTGQQNGIAMRNEFLGSHAKGRRPPSDSNIAGSGAFGDGGAIGAIGGEGLSYMSHGPHEMNGQPSSQHINDAPSKQQILVLLCHAIARAM